MYCSECGAKLKKDDLFCGECGTKVKENKKTSTTPKTRQPMSKEKKKVLIIVVVILCLFFGAYKYTSFVLGPSGVTNGYMASLKKNSLEDIYKSLSIEGDTTFTTLEEFKKVYNEEENSFKDIKSYSLEDVIYSDDKKSATVRINVKKENGDEKTLLATLNKSDKKKYFFFDDWKVETLTNNGYSITGVEILKNFEIKVPKNSKLNINGTDVDPKFIESDSYEEGLDVYVIPNLFVSTIHIKTTLPNQMVIEDDKTLTNYSNQYEVQVSLSNLTDDMVTTLKDQVKEDISNLYENIIAKKNWDSIKENYAYNNVNLSSLEEDYMDLYNVLTKEDLTLKKFDVTSVTLSNVKLSEEGKLVITVKYNYDYTVDYKSFTGDEKEKNGQSSYSSTLTYDYYDNAYKLNEVYNMVSRFSTW